MANMSDTSADAQKMKSRFGLYEKATSPCLSWEERLTFACRSGFDYVEMSLDETEQRLSRLKMPRQERLALLRLGSEIGTPVESFCLSGHRKFPLGSADPEIRKRGMEIMEQAVVLAHDLGVRIIQIAGYDVYYEPSTDETQKWFEENLHKSVETAASWGVTLGFETMETPFLNTVSKCMHYVELAASPWLSVYPDCGNMMNAALSEGHDILDDLRSGAGHLCAMHLKETVPGKFREIPFGTGHVPFVPIIAEALKLGIRRFTAELWYTDEDSWKQAVHYARAFLGKKLKEAERSFQNQ